MELIYLQQKRSLKSPSQKKEQMMFYVQSYLTIKSLSSLNWFHNISITCCFCLGLDVCASSKLFINNYPWAWKFHFSNHQFYYIFIFCIFIFCSRVVKDHQSPIKSFGLHAAKTEFKMICITKTISDSITTEKNIHDCRLLFI